MQLIELLIPVIALSIMPLAHIIVFRVTPINSIITSFLIAFVTGLLLIVLSPFLLVNEFWQYLAENLLADLIIYTGVSFGYFNVVNVGYASIRIKLLSDIFNNNQGLTLKELKQSYSARSISELRLQRLVLNHHRFENNKIYTLGKRKYQLYLGKLYLFLRAVIIGRKKQ